jgi:2-polyprenyl-3-methyl-5-hydroxy-6-metoxy-1,4-benzoquinol methylase
MTPDDKRSAARELSAQYEKTANPLGWFDALYKNAAGHPEKIPWAELRPNPYLLQWLDTAHLSPRKALVIGSGLGDDAEFLTSRSWTTTAFDISPEAINWSRRRFPNSKVDYQIASVLEPPATWRNKFDLVVEIFTLQALPRPLHLQAIPKIAELIAPSGRLFLFARARNDSDPPGSMPWPLTEKELREFEKLGLQPQSFEDFLDEEEPPVRRFRAIFRRNV